jgi:hypothetical protein
VSGDRDVFGATGRDVLSLENGTQAGEPLLVPVIA